MNTPTCERVDPTTGEVCGRRTVVRTIRERSLTDTAYPQVRVCPEHGDFWRAKDRRPEPPAGTP